jgi:hypothetical protein
VLFTELAQTVGVPTPTMDAVIQTASALLGRDLSSRGTSDACQPGPE